MKKLFLGILLISAAALASGPISVEALVKDAAKLDGKSVIVRGKVSKYNEKVSKKGNPYTTFIISSGKSNANVYLKGRPGVAVKDGLVVEVSGNFLKLKKLRDFSVANEIDASAEPGKTFGVKLVKAK